MAEWNLWNVCRETDAPASAADSELYATHAPAWSEGMPCVDRGVSAGSDSGILAVTVGVLVLIGLNMKHVRRLFRDLPQDLLSVRRRANAFDEHTANESRVAILTLLQLFVFEGIMLFMRFGVGISSARDLDVTVLALAGLAGAFYLFGLTGCVTLGYVFADSVNAGLLRRGFNASQILLGFLLAVPAFISLFYPSLVTAMFVLSGVLYVITRICYVSKGFRIFYHNLPSLLYFILYLCTLEIIPVIIVCLLAREICVNLN